MNRKVIVIILILFKYAINFQFIYPNINLDILTINTPASYTFVVTRSYDQNLNQTPWNTQLVPLGAQIRIMFPSQYQLLSDPLSPLSCDMLLVNNNPVLTLWSCSEGGTSGNMYISISGVFDQSEPVQNLVISISKILNPSPALTTGSFVIIIGNDQSANVTGSATVTLEGDQFTSCGISFNPSYVNTTGDMQFNIELKNEIQQGGYITIRFPPSLQWENDISTVHQIPIEGTLTCTLQNIADFSFLSSIQCVGETSTQIVTVIPQFSGSGTISGSLSISISGMFSPPTTQPIDILQIKSKSLLGYDIDMCTSTIEGLTAKLMTVNLVPTVSPFSVNKFGGLKIQFTLADTIEKTDIFRLYLPADSRVSYLFKASSLSLNTAVVYDSTNQIMTFTQSNSARNYFKNEQHYITFLSYTAPPSTRETNSFRFVIMTSTNYEKMAGTDTLQASANSYSLAISTSNDIVNLQAIYSLTFSMTDPLKASGKIVVTVPSTLSFANNPPSCPTFTTSPTLIDTPTCTFIQNADGTYKFTLNTLNKTTSDIASQVVTIHIHQILNYFSSIQISGFYVKTYYTTDDADLVAQATGGSVQLLPNNISITDVVVNETITNEPFTQYAFTIFSESGIPQANSKMMIYWPDTLIPDGSLSCELTEQGTPHTVSCSMLAGNVEVNLGALIIQPASEIQLSVGTFTNPSTTASILFSVSTFDSGSNLIDESPVEYQFSNILISRGFQTLSVVATLPQNFATTSYTFSLSLLVNPAQLLNQSQCVIVFPQQIAYSLESTLCQSADQLIDLTCLITNTSVSVTVDQVITCQTSTCSLSFMLTSIINPESFQPTQAFSISLQTSDFQFYANDVSRTISNSIPQEFPNIAYDFNEKTYGEYNTDLEINITNDGVLSQIIVLDVSAYQFQNPINLDCSATSFSMNKCQYIPLNNSVVIAADIPLPLFCTISLKGLFITPQPPSNISTIFPSIPISSYTIGGYLIYSSPETIRFTAFCTLPCATCSLDDPTLCYTCYDPDLLFEGACLEQCPSGAYESIVGVECSRCASECKECENEATYCVSCFFESGFYLFLNQTQGISTCLQECPATTFVSNDSCLYCQSPCQQCVDTAITCLSCLFGFYNYFNETLQVPSLQCLVTCPSDITIPDSIKFICEYCTSPCSLCENLLTNCTQCQSGYYFIEGSLLSQNENQCVVECPQGMVSVDNVTCSLCLSPCLTCFIDQTTCLACIEGFYQSSVDENLCVENCEQLSFANDADQICQLCSTIPALNCFNCSSSTACLSCDDPEKSSFVFFQLNSSCLAEVPPGYVNISGIAVECTDNCTECWVTTDNCTQCEGIFGLFIANTEGIISGSCLEQCPSGYTNVNNICEACVDPCLECSSTVSTCTQCLPQKITYNGQCIDPEECPVFTYPVLEDQSCTPCDQPCEACLNQTFCQTCTNGSLIDGGICTAQCPEGEISLLTEIDINGEIFQTFACILCLTPCLTCSIQDFNCTTCIEKFYYYPQIYRCFQVCPANITIPDSQTLTCIQCQFPCKNCSITITTCTSCVANYYLAYNSATCVSECGPGYYPIVGMCQKCTNNCSTCLSATLCLTCTGVYYLYGQQCITQCPITHAIYGDNVCESCSPWCLNCSKASSIQESVCFVCQNPTILYNQTCLQTCPSSLILYLNTTNAKYYCLTQQQYAEIQLGISLALQSLFPLPFTIAGCIIMIATFMSRLQFQGSYIIGIAYCLFGVLEVGSLIYFIVGIYGLPSTLVMTAAAVSEGSNAIQYDPNIFLLLAIAVGIIYGLNIIGLIVQSIFLFNDKQFVRWSKKSDQSNISQDEDGEQTSSTKSQCCPNYHSYVVVTILSLLTSYKLKILLFTGLFKFEGLSAILDSVQKFRIFNVFSFLGFLHEGLVMYIVYLIFKAGVVYQGNEVLFLALIDLIIITGICFILAILSTHKEDNFFDILKAVTEDRDEQESLVDSQGNVKKIQKKHPSVFVSKPNLGIRPDMKGFRPMDSHSRLTPQNQDQQTPEDDQIVSLTVSEEQYEHGQNLNHNIFSPARANKVSNAFWVEKEEKQEQGIPKKKQSKMDHKNAVAPLPKPSKKSKQREEKSKKDVRQSKQIQKDENVEKDKKKDKKKQTNQQAENIQQKNEQQEIIQRQQVNKERSQEDKKIELFKQTRSVIPSKHSSEYSNFLYKKSNLKKQHQSFHEQTKQQELTENPQIKETSHKIEQQDDVEDVKLSQKISDKQFRSSQYFKKPSKINKNIESSEIDVIQEKRKSVNLSHDQPSFQQLLPFVHNEEKGEFIYKQKNISRNQSKNMSSNRNIFDRPLEEPSEEQPDYISRVQIKEEVKAEQKKFQEKQVIIQQKNQKSRAKSSVKQLSNNLMVQEVTQTEDLQQQLIKKNKTQISKITNKQKEDLSLVKDIQISKKNGIAQKQSIEIIEQDGEMAPQKRIGFIRNQQVKKDKSLLLKQANKSEKRDSAQNQIDQIQQIGLNPSKQNINNKIEEDEKSGVSQLKKTSEKADKSVLMKENSVGRKQYSQNISDHEIFEKKQSEKSSSKNLLDQKSKEMSKKQHLQVVDKSQLQISSDKEEEKNFSSKHEISHIQQERPKKQRLRQQKIYRRDHSFDEEEFRGDSFDDKIAEKQSKLEVLKSDLRKQMNRKRSREKLSKEKPEKSFQPRKPPKSIVRRSNKNSLHNYSMQAEQLDLTKVEMGKYLQKEQQREESKKTDGIKSSIKKDTGNEIKEEQVHQDQFKIQQKNAPSYEHANKKSGRLEEIMKEKSFSEFKEQKVSINDRKQMKTKHQKQPVFEDEKNENEPRKIGKTQKSFKQKSDQNQKKPEKDERSLAPPSQKKSIKALHQQTSLHGKRDPSDIESANKSEQIQEFLNKQKSNKSSLTNSLKKQKQKESQHSRNADHNQVIQENRRSVKKEASELDNISEKQSISIKNAEREQKFSKKSYPKDAHESVQEQSSQENKDKFDGSIDLKKSNFNEVNKEKTPFFYLEQSSLALRRSFYNQSEKLSNPFDYCNNNQEDQASPPDQNVNLGIQGEQSQSEEEQHIENNNKKYIMKVEDTSQVPSSLFPHQNNQIVINKITEENSQYQEDPEDEDEMNVPRGRNMGTLNQGLKRGHNIAEAIDIRPQNRQRKRLPDEDKDENLHVKGLRPKVYNSAYQQSEDVLEKKSPVKHPLQKIRSPSAERNRGSSSDSLDLEGRQRGRNTFTKQRMQNSRIPSRADRNQIEKYVSHPEFTKPQKFEYEEELDKNSAYQKVSFGQDELLTWKKRFSGKNDPYQDEYAGRSSVMQVPQKPLIGSVLNESSRYRRFDYEETDQNLTKGKLYEFQQVDRPIRGSTSKSGSKSKRRSSSRKEPKSSLQKIYTQKFSRY